MKSSTLNQPLPAEISRRVSFPLMRYLNYPAFSWEWFWRRSVIFGSIGIVVGVMGPINVAIQLNNTEMGLRTLRHTMPLWLCMTLLGAGLGTMLRHFRFPTNVERWVLPLLIIGATLASIAGRDRFNEFYRLEVLPEMMTKGLLTKELLEIGNSPAIRMANTAIFAVMAFVFTGGFGLRAYFRERRFINEYGQRMEVQQLREQRDVADRRLSVLQAQVEPHFLYNTLASVRSLVATDPQRAVATIDALVDHLRATLPKFRDGEAVRATLAEQVEICRSYLEVMRVRMGSRFRYSVQVPENCAPLFFPPLMLISLVENAIKHGVEPKPGACFVTISARRFAVSEREQLEVSVIDDGAGLREGAGGGIGLANIRAQLAARYQGSAELSLEGRETSGVAARITIPIEPSL